MDLLVPFVVPAVAGGVLIAVLMIYGSRVSHTTPAAYRADLEPASTDVINVAHIRVAGVGGLGLVAMALVVAWYLPGIRAAMTAAFSLGLLLAIGMIVWRARTH